MNRNKKLIGAVSASLLAGALVAGAIIPGLNSNAHEVTTTAKERLQAKRTESYASILSMNTFGNQDEVVRAIIELSSDAVADKYDVTEYSEKLKNTEEKILDNQESLVSKVEKITGNKVVNQSAYLVNSISIDATRAQMREIAKLKGIEKVYEATTYTTNMATAVDEGNARKVWEDTNYGYTGEGTVVAIIDSGVNYRHQDMTLDDGVTPKYTKEEWKEKIELLGYGEYFTEKVPFGYDYVAGKEECQNVTMNHGYHVAGIVASNGDTVGVAKNAQVLGIKVFGDEGGGASTDAIVRGIEDSVKLGADVINMSLGTTAGTVSDLDYLQVAVDNATKEGVISCIAASNDGTSTGNNDATNILNLKDSATVGSPAVAESALTVASADNYARTEVSETTVTLGKEDYTYSYMDIMGYGFDFENTKMVNVGIGVDAKGKLTTKAKKIKDKIAVVERGTSTFNDKVYQLSEAGAKGIILVDSEDEISSYISAYDWKGIPVVAVSKPEGQKLLEVAKKGKKYTTVDTKEGEVKGNDTVAMSYFSSWGPTNELGIKPEITAPGGNITAPTIGTDTYETLSGTSMATPFVAGSEAIMLNAIRDRGLNLEGAELVKFMKNSLINTADMVTDATTSNPYSVRYQGAGMVDVYGAVNNNVSATVNGEAKAELKELSGDTTFQITLKNYGKTEASYNLKDAQIYTDYTNNTALGAEYGIKPVANSKITFDKSRVKVAPGEEVTVTATVDLSNDYVANSYVEAFVVFEGQGVENVGLPVLGFYGDWEAEAIIDKSVYEDGTDKLSEVGAESVTSIAASDMEGNIEAILGAEYTKVLDSQAKGEATGTLLNKARAMRATNGVVTQGLQDGKGPDIENAIEAKVGETYEAPIVNAGSSATFKLKATKQTGCVVNMDANTYPLVSVYNKDGELLNTNYFYYMFGMYIPLEFSMSKGDEVYVTVENLMGAIGYTDVTFDESNYDAELDVLKLYKETEKEMDKLVVKNGKTTKVKNNSLGSSTAEVKVKKDGYYTFDFDFKKIGCNVVLTEYSYDNGQIVSADEKFNFGEYGEVSREVKLSKDCDYVMEFEFEGQEDSKDVVATVKMSKSNGENAYTIQTSYNGAKVAFSPNEDGVRDLITPVVSQLRNAKEIKINVLDANKNVVRTIGTQSDATKLLYTGIAQGSTASLLANYMTGTILGWDGTVYDRTTGEYVTAADGQYYIQLEAKAKADSVPQITTMPVRVDTVAPELEVFELRKEGKDTVVEFKVKDDVNVSGMYYVDFARTIFEDEDSEYGEVSTLSKLFVETPVNEEGNYELNLGENVEDSEITFMFEDEAGNQLIEEISEDSDEEFDEEEFDEDCDDEDYDVDMDEEDDEDYEVEYFDLCEGVKTDRELVNGATFGVDEDNEILICGDIETGKNITINGVEAEEEEDCAATIDGDSFWMYVPVQKGAKTADLNIVVTDDKGAELYNETVTINIDDQAPVIELVRNDSMEKVKTFSGYEESAYVLLDKSVQDTVTFQMKLTDNNMEALNEDSLYSLEDETMYGGDYTDEELKELYDTAKYEVKYDGNGVYTVTVTNLKATNGTTINAVDVNGIYSSLHIDLYKNEAEEDFNFACQENEYVLDVNVANDPIITKDMLNEDGTFTIEGYIGKVPEKLVIGGERIFVEPKTKKFSKNVKINKGCTKVGFELELDGQVVDQTFNLYYDDMTMEIEGLDKADDEGVITVTDEKFNLKGVVKSYTSVASIDVCGDNLYTAPDFNACYDGEPMSKTMDYNIKLQKGTNIITVKVTNLLGQEVIKQFTVEYK